MGLTVNDVLERARDEALEAGGASRPAWDAQSGTINDSSLTLTLAGRQTYVPPDQLVEWDDSTMELADVYSTTGAVVTLRSRGYLETDAASHAAGTKVILNPPYPKIVLFNALSSVIGQLYGYGIYWKKLSTALTLSVTGPVSLPSGARDVLAVIHGFSGSSLISLRKGTEFEVIYNGGTTVDAPPQIQFLSTNGVPAGAGLRVGYKADFSLPQDVYDADTSSPPAYSSVLDVDLDTCGIPTHLQPHLPTAIAAHVLMGRDVPLLESEHVAPDPQNPQQPGTRSSVGRMLWTNFITGPVQAERNRLLEANPIQITYTRV